MADNIIYKGTKAGQQVDFTTGSLTDISTFTGDVRGVAIENSIGTATDIGASQAAIRSMSGYLASNAHPDVDAGADIATTNVDFNVIKNLTVTIDDTGHVTATNVSSINLDTYFYTKTGTDSIITRVDNDISIVSGVAVELGYDVIALSGQISGNDIEISQLFSESDTLSGLIDTVEADLVIVSGLTVQNASDIVALSGTMGALTLDDVVAQNSVTHRDITVADIYVSGGNITGPSTMILDPASSGAAGTVVIQGNLDVKGTTTTINSTTIELGDLNITLGTGAQNHAAFDGAGIQLSGTTGLAAEFVWDGTEKRWTTNGDSIVASIVGNADTASAFDSARRVTFAGGDVTGYFEQDYSTDSANVDLTIAPLSIVSGMIVNSTIANAKLQNSTYTVVAGSGLNALNGNSSAELGGSITLNLGGGNAISVNSTGVSALYDNSTIGINGSNQLYVPNNAIGTTQLASGSVTPAVLASNAVETAKIASRAVTSGKIAFDSINGDLIVDNAIDSEHITAGAIDSGHIANGQIVGDLIAAGAVVSGKLGADSVGAYELDSSIAGANITFTDGVISITDDNIRSAISGAASTAISDNFDANVVVGTNGAGKLVAIGDISTGELSYLDGVTSNIQTQLNGKASTSTQVIAGNGLNGGGTLAANRTFNTDEDQSHLDAVEYGTDNTALTNVITKGGVLVLRGKNVNGITTDGTDGEAINLALQTTVAFEGVVQSMDSTNTDGDGETVAMWKIQGVLQRNDADMSMLSSYVTNTYRGSSASLYDINVSVNGSGLNIASDQASDNIITSATLNYNWIQYTA